MFQLILSVDSHNLTGYKMHIAVPQICQINRWNNSFQNMYGMLKATIDRLARKMNNEKIKYNDYICCPKTLNKIAANNMRSSFHQMIKIPSEMEVAPRYNC